MLGHSISVCHLIAWFYIYCFQIFDHGVITFANSSISSCPPTPANVEEFGETFIAVYWIPTAISQGEGEIFYRIVDLTNSTAEKNITEIQELINEINTARLNLAEESNITLEQCESVIYITWFNMKTFPGILMNVSIII